MKLIIKKSDKPGKRLMAIFSEKGKKDVITHFGLKIQKGELLLIQVIKKQDQHTEQDIKKI